MIRWRSPVPRIREGTVPVHAYSILRCSIIIVVVIIVIVGISSIVGGIEYEDIIDSQILYGEVEIGKRSLWPMVGIFRDTLCILEDDRTRLVAIVVIATTVVLVLVDDVLVDRGRRLRIQI